MESHITLALIGLTVLFFLSAVFSGSETALTSMSRHRLKTLRDQHPSKAGAIDYWLNNPNTLLTAILIGLNAVNLLSAIITENIADTFVQKYGWPGWVAPVFSFGVVSFIIIEFCEILPKIIGYHNSERVTLAAIRPIVIFHKMVYPAVKLAVWIANLLMRLLTGKSGAPEGPFITQSEILGIVEDAEEQGVFDRDEREMIRSIVEFGDTQVREVMTPRPDMHIAPADTTVAKMAQIMEELKHSRVPIYEGGKDNVIGIINTRALIKALKEGLDNEPVKNFIHQAHFVPESKMVDDLLHEFQKKRTHIAIVVDEYGTTAGLVTIEDLLEEIVGEIWDEYDTEEPLYRWIDENTLRVDARIDIAELNDLIGARFPDEEAFETLGGLIFHILGKVPKTGEKLVADGFDMSVEKMVGRRIATVVIIKPEKKPETELINGET